MTKDWIGNKASTIRTSGFHNKKSKYERSSNDFYATDPIALEKLLERESFSNVWEAASGMGHLSKVLEQKGILGKKSDLIKRGDEEQIDFLHHNVNWQGDIITNPPYRLSTEFVYKAIETLKENRRVAMIFPQRYLSSKRRYKLFMQYPPQVVYAFSGGVSCALNGDFKAHPNSAVDYLWIIWQKGYKGETKLRWIY